MIACGIGGAALGNASGPFGFIGAIFPLFGLAFIAFGIWNAINSYNKADVYKKAEAQYHRERRELLQKDEAGQDHPA